MITAALIRQLERRGIQPAVLESDALRRLFSEHPRYNERDREYFYASMAFIGEVLTEHGVAVIFDATANRRSYRERARRRIPQFLEIYVDTPLEICMQRDPKGIYRRARTGEAQHVPGLQAEYEPPEHADIVVRGDSENPEDAAARIVNLLDARGLLA